LPSLQVLSINYGRNGFIESSPVQQPAVGQAQPQSRGVVRPQSAAAPEAGPERQQAGLAVDPQAGLRNAASGGASPGTNPIITAADQCCQISICTIYQNGQKYTK
jgi:hypothetical protein